MAVEFKFPDVGEGIHEGELLKWLVTEGDRVQEHQAIVQFETDKAIVELPSPATGTILKLHHKEGSIVKVGDVLATIGLQGELIEKPVLPTMPAREIAEVMPEKPVAAPADIKTLPQVRAMAKKLGVDLLSVKPTGLVGIITEQDVKTAQTAKPRGPTLMFEQYGRVLKVPLRGARKSIAKNVMTAVQHVPHVTHIDQAEVEKLWEIRQEYKKKADDQGFGLTFLPFIIKAVTIALKQHPFLNASLDEEKEEIVLKQYYNIGFAVDTTEGLLVPVLKNADHMSIFNIAKNLQALSEKARNRELTLEDMHGSTFTITNIGSVGGLFFTPIVNYPECAILGTGRIHDAPLVEDGVVAVKKVLPLCLSFDHRILDGAKAARFMNDIIDYLEHPEKMMLDAD